MKQNRFVHAVWVHVRPRMPTCGLWKKTCVDQKPKRREFAIFKNTARSQIKVDADGLDNNQKKIKAIPPPGRKQHSHIQFETNIFCVQIFNFTWATGAALEFSLKVLEVHRWNGLIWVLKWVKGTHTKGRNNMWLCFYDEPIYR